ncbi:MAG: helix-hairpin-helix domain-containing protein [Streptosporangiales bacterium]|nr:helix-hairpin-helix domain-containing protein [Streptosporangiales bacterium]
MSRSSGPAPRNSRLVLVLLVVITALGGGIWTWAVFLALGLRARRRRWLAWAAVYAAATVAFGVLESQAAPGNSDAGFAVIPMIFAWFGGIVHVAAISGDFTRRVSRTSAPAMVAARQRIERRAEGRRLVASDPVLAREIGVGRPDIPGTDSYGLVDVNHATALALCQLPGITPQIAARIEETRRGTGPFTSAEDLCVTMDLPAALTDDLKEHSVYL